MLCFSFHRPYSVSSFERLFHNDLQFVVTKSVNCLYNCLLYLEAIRRQGIFSFKQHCLPYMSHNRKQFYRYCINTVTKLISSGHKFLFCHAVQFFAVQGTSHHKKPVVVLAKLSNETKLFSVCCCLSGNFYCHAANYICHASELSLSVLLRTL